jgi:hypothetical protein
LSGDRCVINIRYAPVSPKAGQSVGRLTNYIQNRDNERPLGEARDAEGFMYYAAYRDRAQPEGRMFNADGTAGDQERRELVNGIRESISGAREGDRAFYQMVISPEDARGVDLRALTRETMRQFQKDCGQMPWIAAEHRNTDHPHVHVVMAARRQREPGRYQTVVISRQRLARAKQAMRTELTRQNGRRIERGREPGPQLQRAVQTHSRSPEHSLARVSDHGLGLSPAVSTRTQRPTPPRDIGKVMRSMSSGLAALLEAGVRISREIERRQRREVEDERRLERGGRSR